MVTRKREATLAAGKGKEENAKTQRALRKRNGIRGVSAWIAKSIDPGELVSFVGN
jgi:hypothetical protein